MKAIYKALCLIAAAIITGCSGQPTQQSHSEGENTQHESKKKKEPSVFSLFKQDNKEGLQLYHNSNRLATISIDNDREVLAMKVYKNSCYLLVSQLKSDTAIVQPSEIYKNGRPAMTFDSAFVAKDMDMNEGHFYVMGNMDGNDTIIVYRDGIKELAIPSRHRKACGLGSFRQDIYVAFQANDSIEITKNGDKIGSLPGICRDFRVSHIGYYTLTDSAVYSDLHRIMQHQEYYRSSDKELLATPMFLSISNTNCYVGAHATIINDFGQFTGKYYAAVFRNKEGFLTIKPDNNPLGPSDIQTRCAGVATCDEDNYTASYRVTADEKPLSPCTFQYYLNDMEKFTIDFGENSAHLLRMESEME